MRVILDTNVLWDSKAIARVQAGADSVIVPAIVFTERARQMVRSGRSVDELWNLIWGAGFEVEAFLPHHGLRIAANVDDITWRRHARDAIIAGHVGPDDELWTHNGKDFLAVGLAAHQIVAV